VLHSVDAPPPLAFFVLFDDAVYLLVFFLLLLLLPPGQCPTSGPWWPSSLSAAPA
jgi:hypothetical protein